MSSVSALQTGPDSRFRFTLRLFAACIVLVGLAMTQSPGLLVPDTKLDLALEPLDFLQRAAHLWDAEGAFGQLQNQAYGYLWPMGPFFAVGALFDMPGWAVQRLWVALVMCVAFVGSAKLSRALGVRSDLACVVAGFAFALSPRMLTTLGPISIEAWPSALTPWVLLPLVIGATSGSPRRAAALSAVAIAMVGGVNAAATFAVLPLAAWWLLTREAGARRRSMMLWWPLFTLLGTMWWLVPLFIMGAYSPPFLDYIESAANTTFPTTIFDALRGTSNWVPYVDRSSRAGNDLIRDFYLPLNAGVVLVAGLAGLMVRHNPHRLFLAGGVVGGLLLVSMGHTGATEGWFAPHLQVLLDDVLAPLRNVHKFDPVIRLPLIIGLAWAVDDLVCTARRVSSRTGRLNARLVVGLIVFAVAASSVPATTGRIAPADGFAEVPDYWPEAAAWLGEAQDEGVALLVPGSSFGTYLWGRPQDEPMQSLAQEPWAVRNAVPLVPAGNIRMLDAVERRLVQGLGSAGLAGYLRRAGVSHLVVRNDLVRSPDIPDPVLVHQALTNSPGLERVASFGPSVGGEAHLEGADGQRILVNGGWQNQYPALEVYEVSGDVTFATTTDEPPLVIGGPEDLLDLTDLGLLGDVPTRLAVDVSDQEPRDFGAPFILTDGLRSVERNFGRLHDASSATRVPGEPRRLEGRVADYEMPEHRRWATSAVYEGAAALTASSSQSDASAYGEVEPGQQPFAAVDGQLDTEWVSGPFTRTGHWWQVDFAQPRAPRQAVITGSGPAPQLVRVRTESTVSDEIALTPGIARTVTLGGSTRWLRVEDAAARENQRLRLAEVEVEGESISRRLVLPTYPEGWGNPDAVVLRAVDDARTGCATVDLATRCVPDRDISSEEPSGFNRTFSLSRAENFGLRLLVQPAAGGALERRLTKNQPVGASASTVGNPDVQGSALAAIDGDPGTTWTAALSDERPELRINWLDRRRVSGLTLTVAPDSAARQPTRIELTWPSGRRILDVDEDGSTQFAPIRTSQLAIRVLRAEMVANVDFEGATSTPVPIGVSEVDVEGLPYLPLRISGISASSRCGSGPDIEVNRERISTRVSASPAELYRGGVFPARICGSPEVDLATGTNTVSVIGSETFNGSSLVLSRSRVGSSDASALASRRPGPVIREGLSAPQGQISARENYNPGWEGNQQGDDVPDLVVDGWQQGWSASGESLITWNFTPDQWYRAGLIGGLGGLVVLFWLGLVRSRRWSDVADRAVKDRSSAAWAVLVAGWGAGGLLAGWTGLGVAVAGTMAGWVLARRLPGSVWVTALLIFPAAVAYAVRPWGDPVSWAGSYPWVGQLSWLAVSVVVGVVAADGRGTRRFKWRHGRSTLR